MEELITENNEIQKEEKQREKGIVVTSSVGIGGNFLLVAIKAAIGFLAGSVAIITDALNNLTDAISSIITIVGTKLAGKKPDKKHPYGHGRIEYLTSTIIGFIILFAGGMAIYESIVSIIDYFKTGVMPQYTTISLIVIAVAIVIKIALGLFFRIRAKKLNSDALKASGMDALFDSILSLGTLIAALVALYAHVYIEGYVGIAIGLFILRSGFGIIKDSLSLIIGKKLDEDIANSIKAEILSVPGVNGVYDLILNSYGTNKYIGSVHIGVPDNMSASDIMKIEEKIAFIMYFKHNIIMTTGVYAQNTQGGIAQEIQDYLEEITGDDPNVIQTHGFYFDKETNLVHFDLVISFDDPTPQETLNIIQNTLKEKYPDYSFYGAIDREF